MRPRFTPALVRRAPLALAALGAALWIATACSRDASESATETARSGAPAARAAVEAWGDDPARVFLGDRIPSLRGPELEEVRRRDPRADGWPSEAYSGALAAQLGGLFEDALRGDAAAAAARFVATPAAVAALLPEATTTLREDGAVLVRRADAPDSAATGLDARAAGELCARLGALAPAASDVDAAVEPVLLTLEGGRLHAEALVELRARDGASPVQVTATVRVTAVGLEELRLERLELVEWEHVRFARAPFADVARAALTPYPGLDRELRTGVEDYHGRLDRLVTGSAQGMQGLAVGDANGDGFDDLYVCQQGGLPNRLLVRAADGTFRDATAGSGVGLLDLSRSALFLDLDDDGHQDLAIAVGADVVVALNDGTGRFPRQGLLAGVGPEQIYSLSAADPDRDGDLDIFATRYGTGGVMRGVPTPYHDAQNGARNMYWRNEGGGQWALATEEAGFDQNNTRFSLCSIWEDFDADGDLDLYVVNDFGRNCLFQNDGRGGFTDVAGSVGAEDMAAGMGATCADFDLDGDVDVYVTNMFSAPGLRVTAYAGRFLGGALPGLLPAFQRHARGNTLLVNRGDGTFEDMSREAGVTLGRWGWGGKFLDFDADGLEDLYVPAGFITSRRDEGDLNSYFWRRVTSQSPPDGRSTQAYQDAWSAITHMSMYGDATWSGRERNSSFLNLGDGRFANVSRAAGIDFADDSRSAAVLDLDDDGRPDVALKNRTAPRLRILHNRFDAGQRTLVIELEAAGPNRDAIGALVRVEAGGRVLRRRLYAGEGYLAQSSKRLFFGLGDAAVAERVSVSWPDGSETEYAGLAADARYRLAQADPAPARLERAPAPAFAAGGAAALEPLVGAARRVLLAAKLPFAGLALPSFTDGGRLLSDFAGSPVLVVAWSVDSPASRRTFEALARERDGLAQSGLRVVPICTDSGRELVRARRALEESPFAPAAGFADGRAQQELEFALLEVLGFFHELPLPTSFLFDPAGSLIAFYPGELELRAVAEDLQSLRRSPPDQPLTTALSGGRWVHPPRRDLSFLAQVFTRAGNAEMAQYLQGVLGR